MSYVPLELMLEKTDYSIYKLVTLAAKRAMEIAEGQPKLIEVDKSVKPSTVAMLEIASNKLTYKKVKA